MIIQGLNIVVTGIAYFFTRIDDTVAEHLREKLYV